MSSAETGKKLTVGCLIFPNFELLDVMGPLEFWGVPATREHFHCMLVSEHGGPVRSTQGITVMSDHAFEDCPPLDVLLVPGGLGTRQAIADQGILKWLRSHSPENGRLKFLISVCTGAALLAVAGLLDGRRATTNKHAFDWVASQSDKVVWQKDLRWVVDGNVITAGGVSCGMDMAIQFVNMILGSPAARTAATYAEYRGDWENPKLA